MPNPLFKHHNNFQNQVMNKTEFIRYISEKNTISIKNATNMVNTVLGAIADAVSEDGQLVIPDFGRFRTTVVKAHEVTIPTTHKTFIVPQTKRIVFKPYKRFSSYSTIN